MKGLEPVRDERLLRGIGDDAAVWRVPGGGVVVQTVDFFSPVVDEPASFGAVAAANAISDVYAMGCRPAAAIGILAWPSRKLASAHAVAVLRGALDKARESGALLADVCVVEDPRPKFGLVVSGLGREDELFTMDGARPGDLLYLSKPLGAGILATAIKKGLATEEDRRAVLESMTTLNTAACAAAREAGSRAATDVTGFGLLGHAHRIIASAGASPRLSMVIDWPAVPVLEGARRLRGRCRPGGTVRNLEVYAADTAWDEGCDEEVRELLADPQTSGGLLIAIAPDRAERLERALRTAGVKTWARIGRVGEAPAPGAPAVRVSTKT